MRVSASGRLAGTVQVCLRALCIAEICLLAFRLAEDCLRKLCIAKLFLQARFRTKTSREHAAAAGATGRHQSARAGQPARRVGRRYSSPRCCLVPNFFTSECVETSRAHLPSGRVYRLDAIRRLVVDLQVLMHHYWLRLYIMAYPKANLTEMPLRHPPAREAEQMRSR